MSISKWLFAQWYDVLNSIVEPKVIPYRHLTAGKSHGKTLEVGGGTGANLPYFQKTSSLTVVEPDVHMRNKLSQRVNHLNKDISIVKSFGETLPFEDNSFDSVVTTLVLCMVHDVEKVILEIYRVLKPGGNFFFYEHTVAESFSGKLLQQLLDPIWIFATTGCHLKRDILGAIKVSPFTKLEYDIFNLNVGIPITIPNIVGSVAK
jgi:ubiquinone/menaquinone biosynthesis C-methylase UbiE